MIYIVKYTIASQAKPEFEIVDKEKDLAKAVEKLDKHGQGITINHIYEAESINYEFIYEDKQKTIIEKVPKFSIIR